MRSTTVLALLITSATVAAVAAAELSPAAEKAFAEISERARAAFVGRVTSPIGNSGDARLDGGAIVSGPATGDGIVGVDGGLVHHWRAAGLIAGATLDEVLAISRDYPGYPKIFRPVVSAKILSHSGDAYQVQFRMYASAGGLSATLDVKSAIQYERPDARHAYVISGSEEIREVKNAGQSSEHQLPVGRDSGYLWRAAALTRFVEEDAGVTMEMETVGLSRGYPPLLGWVIEPIARRVGRRSAETSVQEFRTAVLARRKAGVSSDKPAQ